nr:diguanylate cyclase [Pseudoteredinibacter isoporae]
MDALKSAVWVYDVLNYRIHWANKAALRLWESDNLSELTARDFKPGSSAAVQQTLCSYLDEFKRGRVIDRWWQISPKNIDKRVHCRFSGVMTAPGHMSMLVEGLHSELLQGDASEYGTVMICLIDAQGVIQSANPPFERQFGISVPYVQGIVHEAQDLSRLLAAEDGHSEEMLCASKSGPRWHSVEVRKHNQEELEANSTSVLSLTLLDIHDRKLAELKNAVAADTDALTGLFNRRGITRQLQSKISEGCTVFFIDLDEFKPINDRYGHAVGDEVLCHVAKVLRYEVHQSAICARLGGDEFLMAIPGSVDVGDLNFIAQQLIQQLTQVFLCSDQRRLNVTASVGSASIPEHASDIDALLQKADAAMYVAKQRGRNRYVHYSTRVKEQLMRSEIIVQQLDESLQGSDSLFEYQAIKSLSKGEIFVFEAYLHWPNPLLRSLRAHEVNEALVKANRLYEVEESLLKMMNDEFSELKGKRSEGGFRLAFNVSASQLIEESFLTRAERCLRNKHLNLDNLVFEISERALKRVLDHQADFFTEAGKQGFKFALDNFGSGCSPLMDLQTLPLQYVKLSSKFSRNISDHMTVIRCIVDLCHRLQIPCIADGVNSSSVSEAWSRLGVHLQQGEFVSPKVPLQAFANHGLHC